MKKVLQVNVKLSEGGAAGVARTIADELRTRGIASPFAYGYGRHGRASAQESMYDGIRTTPGVIAAVNRTHYGLRGAETKLRSPKLWHRLAEEIRDSDIVHLHVIHSYFANTAQLFDALIQAGKPVVWTLHDQWIMTGRCAQPDTCKLWQSGCKVCPNLAAYPPAKIDHAAPRWIERRSLVHELQDRLPTAIVACADWLAKEAELAGFKNISVVKNSVDREFWQQSESLIRRPRGRRQKNLFICRDLRDRNKVSVPLLGKVAQVRGQHLTIMGDNAPNEFDSLNVLPATSDRRDLAEVMSAHDKLIFTSSVDYFPLTIAEALTSGMEVVALDSQAAREFQRHPLMGIARSHDHLLELVSESEPLSDDVVKSASEAREQFNPARMVDQYESLYLELCDEGC